MTAETLFHSLVYVERADVSSVTAVCSRWRLWFLLMNEMTSLYKHRPHELLIDFFVECSLVVFMIIKKKYCLSLGGQHARLTLEYSGNLALFKCSIHCHRRWDK